MDELLFGLTRDEWLETALAAGIVAGSIVVASLITVVASRIVHHFTRSTESSLDDRIAERVRLPFIMLVTIWALVVGIETLSYGQEHSDWVHRAGIGLSVLAVAVALRGALVEVLHWHAARPDANRKLHPGSVPLIRRGMTLLIFAVAGLIFLDTFGIAISPLLAGLGIGGIAVALALQPLLANIFASSYMLSDSSIRIGDWIEIDGGPAGIVDDIGWRATRIRSFDNNVVIVPNSSLADSTVTNYSLTGVEADARVELRVALEEDLERVEQVARDAMTRLKEEWPTAVKEHNSVFSYSGFSDSNVEILLKMRAQTWIDSFGLRHELVKRIHAAFVANDIRINYPARRLLIHEADATGLDRIARTGSRNGAAEATPTRTNEA